MCRDPAAQYALILVHYGVVFPSVCLLIMHSDSLGVGICRHGVTVIRPPGDTDPLTALMWASGRPRKVVPQKVVCVLI